MPDAPPVHVIVSAPLRPEVLPSATADVHVSVRDGTLHLRGVLAEPMLRLVLEGLRPHLAVQPDTVIGTTRAVGGPLHVVVAG